MKIIIETMCFHFWESDGSVVNILKKGSLGFYIPHRGGG